jgi:V/A-type H+-transporting ATPase subunit K
MAIEAGLIALAAGIAVGLTGLGTGWAEKDIGSAAVGAIAENEKLFGKGITLMVLPETIVIFGFAIAFLLMGYI